MAFSDLISRPLTAPLEGLDKSIATGVELANNQYRTQLAMEQNQMEREKIQQTYLDKANNLLPNLLKTTGKARSLLTSSYMNLMAKGGMPVNQDTMDLIGADDQLAPGVLSVYQEGKRIFGNDPAGLAAYMAEKLGVPPGDSYSQITGVIKGQESARAAMSRAIYQQGQVAQRQMTASQLKREDTAQKEVSGLIDKTNQYFQTLTPSLGQIEGIFGTKEKPKKVQLSELNALLPAFARTIGGEKGPLSDDDVKRVLANTLELKVDTLGNYLTGKTEAPKELTDRLRERYSIFKGNLIREGTSKLFDKIEEKQLAPGLEDMFAIEPTRGGVILGVGAAQLVTKANNVLMNNRAASGKFNLNKWINSQAAPPSQQQILAEIKKRSQSGNVISFGGLKPTKQGFNVIYAAPEQEESAGEE